MDLLEVQGGRRFVELQLNELTRSTGGARDAPGLESRLCGIIFQSQSAALDNPTPSANPF